MIFVSRSDHLVAAIDLGIGDDHKLGFWPDETAAGRDLFKVQPGACKMVGSVLISPEFTEAAEFASRAAKDMNLVGFVPLPGMKLVKKRPPHRLGDLRRGRGGVERSERVERGEVQGEEVGNIGSGLVDQVKLLSLLATDRVP